MFSNGESRTYYDDEIIIVEKGKNLVYLKLHKEGETLSILVAVGDPWNNAVLMKPSEIFSNFTMRWITLMYTLFYYLIYTPLILFPEIFLNPAMMMFATALVVYMVMTYRTFRIPSINYIVYHEWGTWDGIRLFVPAPQPHSRLSFEQVMKYVGYLKSPEFRDEAINELTKKLEVLHEENLRLYTVLSEMSRRMGNIYEKAVADVALVAPAEVIEKIKKQVMLEFIGRQRLFIALMIVLPILAFAIGFLLAGGSISIEVPVSNTVVGPSSVSAITTTRTIPRVIP